MYLNFSVEGMASPKYPFFDDSHRGTGLIKRRQGRGCKDRFPKFPGAIAAKFAILRDNQKG
jgi:hypothetical protein